MTLDDTTPAPGSRTRAVLLPLLKTGVSIALLALLFSKVEVGRLWTVARTASVPWLTCALALYFAMILVSAWRWGLLLRAQHIPHPFGRLTSSFLVATFFNNFLPSNIGGDVVRIADTAPAAGSKTLATTVVLVDRGLGLLGLVLVAALGASAGTAASTLGPIGPAVLWVGFGIAALLATSALLMPNGFVRVLQPLRILHPEWVGERLDRLTTALGRFKEAPGSLALCFAGAVGVQAILVAFYLAISHSLDVPIGFSQLAVLVPVSFLVQMAPVSMNGFGVREATFGLYFTRLGLPLESALLVSFIGAGLVLLFSLSGGVVYVLRQRQPGRHDTLESAARSA